MPSRQWNHRHIRFILIFFLAACSSGSESAPVTPQATLPETASPRESVPVDPEKNSTNDWQLVSGDQAVQGGDLVENKMLVIIPGGSFDQETPLQIDIVAETPDMPSAEMTLSHAIEISAGGPLRLNKPTTITFLVSDADDLKALADGSLWATYFNGMEWEYFRPTRVDLEASTLSIDTYHFSLQGYGRISLEERLNQYAHSQAISSFVQAKTVDETLNQIISQTMDHLLTDRLRISDDSLKAKVITSLVNDDAWGSMVEELRAGNVTDFVKTLNVFAGQKIVENIDESQLASTLESVSTDSGVEFTQAAAQAAAYLTEGQPKQAARILGEKIADQFLVTTLAKGAVEAVQYRIDTWKDAEIEAAFQAYKNGANGYFWGYNVDPLQFDELYNQMRGIAVRLEQEAVQRELQRREEMLMPPATETELNAIREGVKISLKNQFDQRIQEEQELARQEANIQLLIAKMQTANLLETNRFGFDPDYDTMETRLDKLFHLAKKILRDTGRSDWTSGSFTTENEISAAEMATLMQIWYSEGRDQYVDEIFKRYGIRLMPSCRWEYVETNAYLSDGGGRFVVSFDGANQVTTSYEFEGALSCDTLTFNSTHTWSEPAEMLIPGDSIHFSVTTGWALDGDRTCSGLTAGVKTSLNSGAFSVSAGDNSIPTSVEPEGSVSAEGEWTVPDGSPGDHLEVMAAPDGGGAGGTVRYTYDFICVDN